MLAPGARKVAGAPGPVFVDAPVSGGVIGAVAGTLTFMVREGGSGAVSGPVQQQSSISWLGRAAAASADNRVRKCCW
jgi:hypothetical protein